MTQSFATVGIFAVSLPIPPSVNNLFSNVPGKGRVKTKAYTDWISKAYAAINHETYSSPGISLSGAVCVVMEINRSHVGRDIDNCIKPVIDVLVKRGVIISDTNVASVTACWAEKADPALAKVVVYPVGETPFINFKPSEPGSVTGPLEFRR